MEFEFDPAMSASNKAKHGIDFIEAQALWDDLSRLDIPARVDGEPRMVTMGRVAGKHWVAIWTPRGASIRIISVRRARKEEVGAYENGRI